METQKQSRDFHKIEWQLAHDSGKERAAKFHKEKYEYYSEMYERTKKRVSGEE